MTYKVLIIRVAERELDRLPSEIRQRIAQRILRLEANPRPSGVRKLRQRDEYRLRVGVYRLLYHIDDDSQSVTITSVAHRREAYR